MQAAINKVREEIDSADISLAKYAKTMRELEWSYFSFTQDRIGQMTQESNFLMSLLTGDNVDKQGNFTDTGMTNLGLHGMNYNIYMNQADQYAKEIKKINKDIAKDPYNTDLITQREKLLKLQQDSIKAANDEKDAMVALVEEGIKAQLDALKELIDSYEDSLDAAKSLNDYRKNIEKQTANIASLQKQITAYGGDTSEENISRLQKLNQELIDAQEELEETQYDQYIKDQKKLLDDLYLEYGSKLLEGNVRSFLSVRGKVNKSIQSTIKNYPEMFFAYNNGIAATATDIDTEMTPQGLVITRIKDLQIVNGGQTTASIANTLLTAKKNETVDLSRLYVPMKISVLEHAMAEKIIPKISEYSNSQNKVDASDFFSNHPFHIRMEEYSRKTPIPSNGGNQFQQYWFYERTRGQYNQGKMKFGAKSSQLKKYTDRYPEKMVITMLDLARYMEIYECAPDIVSKGKQKTLQKFAEEIKTAWQKSNEVFNAFYYKRVVALGIMYKCTDEIIKQTEWYKEKRSYKANVIAYTLSLIFYYIRHNKKGYEVDFDRIWNMQDIYEELEDQIKVLTKEVYDFITGPRETENVTEWCKKEICWSRAKAKVWTFNDPFLYSLVSAKEIEKEVKEGFTDLFIERNSENAKCK